MRLLAITLVLFSILVGPLLAVSSSPKKKKKASSDGWQEEQHMYVPLQGSTQGKGVVMFKRKGKQRRVSFFTMAADHGEYDVFLFRGQTERAHLGRLTQKKHIITLDDNSPHLANIYGGYWEGCKMIRVVPEATNPPPTPPRPQEPQPVPSGTPEEGLDF